MELTKREQAMFDGEQGEAAASQWRYSLHSGKSTRAENMIPVTSAQVAGVSYKTIGEAGLEYLQDMATHGAKVRVKTFLNPAGMDRRAVEGDARA